MSARRRTAPRRTSVSCCQRKRKSDGNEMQIHIAVIQHLKSRARKGMLWWHTPNGGMRTKSEAAKLAAMGVLAGVPDLILMANGRTYGLELKTSTGRPSPEQKATLSAMETAGAVTAIAYGLDRALAILEAWGLLLPNRAAA